MIQQLKIHAGSFSFWRKNQCRDSGEAVVAMPMLDYGCFAFFCPASPDQRLQHEARFVDKNNASFITGPLFLSVATLSLATLAPLGDPVPCSSARVSDKKNPAHAAADPNGRDGKQRRTLARPIPQSSLWSKDRHRILIGVGPHVATARA